MFVKIGEIKKIIPIFELTDVSSSNQPANDDIQVISSSENDTQKITLFGVDNSDVFQTKELTLNGTTAVDSVLTPKWKTLYGAFLGDIYGDISARAVGTITIREKSGAQAITTIAATELSTGRLYFNLPGENIILENVSDNSWFNHLGIATTTGKCGQLTGRMAIQITTESDEYLSLISDGSGSTMQIYVLDKI
jgi:hypothetical protein